MLVPLAEESTLVQMIGVRKVGRTPAHLINCTWNEAAQVAARAKHMRERCSEAGGSLYGWECNLPNVVGLCEAKDATDRAHCHQPRRPTTRSGVFWVLQKLCTPAVSRSFHVYTTGYVELFLQPFIRLHCRQLTP